MFIQVVITFFFLFRNKRNKLWVPTIKYRFRYLIIICQKEWKMPGVSTLENRNKTHYVQDLKYMYFSGELMPSLAIRFLNPSTSEEKTCSSRRCSSEFEQQSSQYLTVMCEHESKVQSHRKHQAWPHALHWPVPAWHLSSVLESSAIEPEYTYFYSGLRLHVLWLTKFQ